MLQILITALKHKLEFTYYRQFLSEKTLPAENRLISDDQNGTLSHGETILSSETTEKKTPVFLRFGTLFWQLGSKTLSET